MRVSRGRLALWVGLLLALAGGLAIYLARTPAADAARGPIVIGVLHALSGPMARSEAPLVAAVKMAVDELNAGGGLLGRRVELKVEDSRSDPGAAAAAAERLIGSERAVALFGCGTSTCRQAVSPVVEAHRHLLFYPAAHEGMEQSPHIVYTGPTPNQQALPATDWAMRSFGRRVYVVGTDGLYQRRLGVVLRDFIRLGGGQLLGERYVPLGGADTGAVMADLRRLQPDVVLSTVSGEGNQALFHALVAAGLADLPLLSLGASEPEMQAFGGGRLGRHFTAWSYLQRQPGAAGEAAPAGDPAVSAYVGVRLWAAAVREIGSVQTEAVNANVLHQSVGVPQGSAVIDSRSRHLWRPLRIAQVRPGGRLDEVLLLPGYIRPEPWPAFRSNEYWAAEMSRIEGGP